MAFIANICTFLCQKEQHNLRNIDQSLVYLTYKIIISINADRTSRALDETVTAGAIERVQGRIIRS